MNTSNFQSTIQNNNKTNDNNKPKTKDSKGNLNTKSEKRELEEYIDEVVNFLCDEKINALTEESVKETEQDKLKKKVYIL